MENLEVLSNNVMELISKVREYNQNIVDVYLDLQIELEGAIPSERSVKEIKEDSKATKYTLSKMIELEKNLSDAYILIEECIDVRSITT